MDLISADLSTAIDKFDVQLGKNSYAENIIKAIINPCAEILLPLIGPTYVLREKFQQPLPLQSSQSIRALTVRGLITRVGEVCSLTAESLKQLGITKVEELPEYQKIHGELLEKLQSRAL
jgi:hypothetical protein